jgi:hypothetical protein
MNNCVQLHKESGSGLFQESFGTFSADTKSQFWIKTGGVAHIPGLATVAKSSWYFCLYTGYAFGLALFRIS